eukprot:jgi/Phyca11/532198/estExt2_fgenesh1_pg.C_PHYCAscaffold_40142
MVKKRAGEAAPAPAPGDTDAVSGGRATSIAPVVTVAILSKAEQSRVEYRGKGEVLGLGEIYLNDLSDIFVFEVTNQKARKLKLQLRAELRKPFQTSQWGFQLENENFSIMERELQQEKDRAVASDEFNHVPFSVLRSSSKAALCAENVYLCEGYNELFNHIGTLNEIVLEPKETKRVMFSMCTKLTPQHNTPSNAAYVAAGDSSEEERAHLSETSCFVLSGRLILQPAYVDGSFVKDFTVWNRSEIPLLFKLVSPMTPWSENNELLTKRCKLLPMDTCGFVSRIALRMLESDFSKSRRKICTTRGTSKLSESMPLQTRNTTGIASSKVILMRNMTEGDFYEEDFQQAKRNSFDENPMGDADDIDDDFEFDREPRALPPSPLGSPKLRGSRGNPDLRKKALRTKGKKSAKVPSRVRDATYDSGVDSPRSSPERNIRADIRKRSATPARGSKLKLVYMTELWANRSIFVLGIATLES